MDDSKRYVYVLIAVDEDYRVRECFVLPAAEKETAWKLYDRLREIWGGRYVALASRAIGWVPQNVVAYTMSKDIDDIMQEAFGD